MWISAGVKCTVLSHPTNKVMVKNDFEGREIAILCKTWTLYCSYHAPK